MNAQSGNIFTTLLAGVVVAAALSLALYQTVAGPVSSMVRTSKKESARGDIKVVANTIARQAVKDATSDCDSDGYIEPKPWRVAGGPAGSFPANGGLVPDDIGAQLTDKWGTEYGYCVWDVGTQIKHLTCDGMLGGDNARRLSGTPDPTDGIPSSQTTIAIISAGPDRHFDTSCRDFVNKTTDVVHATVGGAAGAGNDDIVQRQTYAQVRASTPSLWALKAGDDTTAILEKNMEVGPAGTPTLTFNATTGLLSTTGRMKPDAGLSLITAVADGDCNMFDATSGGLVRWNSVVGGLQVCDNADGTFKGMSLDSLEDAKEDTTKYNVFVGLGAGNEGVCPGGVCPAPHGGPFANNTGVGTRAMLNTTTGNNNTALGYQALYANQTGSGNTAIGMESGPSLWDKNNTTAIGYSTYAVNSDTWVIGDLGIKQAIREGNVGESAAMGIATLVDAGDGTAKVTVANTLVTANSRIFLTNNASAGVVSNVLYVSSRNPGVSFTICGSAHKDQSTIAWEIKEPNN